jgi:hypothetical protein
MESRAEASLRFDVDGYDEQMSDFENWWDVPSWDDLCPHMRLWGSCGESECIVANVMEETDWEVPESFWDRTLLQVPLLEASRLPLRLSDPNPKPVYDLRTLVGRAFLRETQVIATSETQIVRATAAQPATSPVCVSTAGSSYLGHKFENQDQRT